MDTAPLKSFATSARTELIREVGARTTAVLAQGSPERVEQPRAVSALERAIAAGGGGDKGKAHVADKVAYTWFNRIIALRFLDANGYTGIGVVSPAAEQAGQPEVLAAAKRGQIDGDVVKGANAATIAGLLNGTRQPRPGVDAQAEAYALLLADYCRYWNRSMPFMFEREGDYTELLIPANLLAEDSVLNRSVKVLTEEVCRDVEVIGWLYQFYISERKDEVFAGFKKNKKAGADEIPAATQLFTPHWIVRYLVENSVGRLWMLNHPESRLIDQMDYYIAPVDEETDFLKITTPEELTVIDPACGSGHMLTYAFDLLYAIYEEEGYTPSQIPGLILTNNLYGTEIDPRAGALAAFALTMKAAAKRKLFLKNPVEPNICVLAPISFSAEQLSYLVTKDGDRHAEEAFWSQFAAADTFGSLIQPDADLTVLLADHLAALDDGGDLLRAEALDRAQQVVSQAEYLSRRYAAVVANPPYMGSKQMNALLSQFMKDEYPDVKQDLYGAFVQRGIALAHPRGLLAIVIGDTWMSIKSFEALRLRLLDGHAFDSFVHMRDSSNHPDIFGANAAFVLSMAGKPTRRAPFIRLTPLGQERKERDLRGALNARTADSGFHLAAGADFTVIPGSPIVYWLSEKMRAVFAHPAIASRYQAKAGPGTRDDQIFLRLHWEVDRRKIGESKKWVLTDKAGEFRKWYAGCSYVMDWENDGYRIRNHTNPDGSLKSRPQNTQFMFREGVTWGKVGSGETSFRWRPQGFGFNDAAPTIFGRDPFRLLGPLNSATATLVLSATGSTLNVQTGMIADLPFGDVETPDASQLASQLVSGSKLDWDSQETSWDFAGNPLVALVRR
ncbi:BREX-1 system adenine-specific DNA-methyltransferase PglX [Microbacterium lacticum]|uniref:BREX-1 system adenine-specific DNA-methyltransferase PglX n=1 Tax=Microbacterium lacticum TaxID=33885 RepID=UPI001F59D7EE|nr:BREX-1 system adenine-specific DNA-methyltransferase PglX [Microbacterium lacticum]